MSDIFDPAAYSIAECKFLIEHLGRPTVVAMQSLPQGVNPKAVQPILQRVNEFEELKKHNGKDWVGVEVLKGKLNDYLRENAKWKAENKKYRKAPRFPSMYSFDAKGRGHRGGVGSDSGFVRSYFTDTGDRVYFAVEMTGDVDYDGWVAPFSEKPKHAGLKDDNEKNRIECVICGHTESYKGESRASHSAARARMSKHLRKTTEKVEEHLEVYASEFQ